MSDSKMGAKVRALLDTAESYETEGNSEAAASYRAKAEQLMAKYRVDQEQALAVNPSVAKPVVRTFDLVGYGSQYKSEYNVLWYLISQHCGLKGHTQYAYDEGGYVLRAHAVGYEEDLNYAEMLFTSVRMVFTERLEPKIKADLSDQVNVYRLRSAGIERVRIAEMMWGNTDKVFLGRVGRLYKAECAERGEEALLSGRGVTGKAYREQYAEQFRTTFHHRLWQARQAAGVSGGALVLPGREERIKEAYYAAYPDMKPAPALPAGEEPARCDKCAKAKRGYCNDHSFRGARMPKGIDPNSVAAQRGRMAGRDAANSVHLRSGGGQAGIGG